MLLELKLVTLEDYRQHLCAASLLKKAKISQGLESDRSRGRAQGGNKTRSIKAKGKVLSGSGKAKDQTYLKEVQFWEVFRSCAHYQRLLGGHL